MIPFVRNVQQRQIRRELVVGGHWGRGARERLLMDLGSPLGTIKRFGY